MKNNNQKITPEVKVKTSVYTKIALLMAIIAVLGVVTALIITSLIKEPITPMPEVKSFTTVITSSPYNVNVLTLGPNNDQFYQLDMKGFGPSSDDGNKPGEPILPSRSFEILLPPEAKTIEKVELVSQEKQELEGNYKIVPGKKCTLTSTKEDADLKCEYVPPKTEIYGSANAYPKNIIETGKSIGQLGKYNLLSVGLNPIIYMPSIEKVYLVKKAYIKITYTSGAKLSDQLLADTGRDGIAEEIITNFYQFKDKYTATSIQAKAKNFLSKLFGQKKEAKAAVARTTVTYPKLCITTEALKSAVPVGLGDCDLVKTKEQIDTEITQCKDNPSASLRTCVDLKEKIRQYLMNNYLSMGFVQVLIVGSDNDVPMRRCAHAVVTTLIPTDYYYAELTSTWLTHEDATRKDVCGLPLNSSSEWEPELNVGRIPLNNTTDISNYFNRSINREKSVMLAAGIMDSAADAAEQTETAYSIIRRPNFGVWRLYENEGTYKSKYCDGDPAVPDTCNAGLGSDPKTTIKNWWLTGANGFPFGIVTLDGQCNSIINCSNGNEIWSYHNYPTGKLMWSNSDISLVNTVHSIVTTRAMFNARPDIESMGIKFIKENAAVYIGPTTNVSKYDWPTNKFYYTRFFDESIPGVYQNTCKAFTRGMFDYRSVNNNSGPAASATLGYTHYGSCHWNMSDFYKTGIGGCNKSSDCDDNSVCTIDICNNPGPYGYCTHNSDPRYNQTCLEEKPYYCDGVNKIVACGGVHACGCPSYLPYCYNSMGECASYCDVGTYGCNPATKQYCDNGVFKNNCTKCGYHCKCATCQSDGSCKSCGYDVRKNCLCPPPVD